MSLSLHDLDSMTIPALKAALAERKQRVGGNKPDLQLRLQQCLLAEVADHVERQAEAVAQLNAAKAAVKALKKAGPAVAVVSGGGGATAMAKAAPKKRKPSAKKRKEPEAKGEAKPAETAAKKRKTSTTAAAKPKPKPKPKAQPKKDVVHEAPASVVADMSGLVKNPSSDCICREPDCHVPVCGCGVGTRHLQVKKEGENKGRFFFRCRQQPQCRFFEWDFDTEFQRPPGYSP